MTNTQNITEWRAEHQAKADAKAERKAKAEAELAELTELAQKVLQYEATFTMVDKLQTPAQRRAHEPIGQSKRWHATCTIAGMTPSEFLTKFDLAEYMYEGFEQFGWFYTKKQALTRHAEDCTEEFVRIMSRLRWDQPAEFAEVVTALKDING